MKELLKLKGNTIGFHPQTQKLELYNTSINTVPYEGTPKEAIHLNGNNMEFRRQVKLRQNISA